MMELIDTILKYLSTTPHAADLLTVAGLGAFLKFVLVPLIKLICKQFKLDITGSRTVLVVYLASLLTVGAVTLFTHTAWSLPILLLVAWQATNNAIAMQETSTALFEPKKMD
jgi:hypothetical protein